MYFDNKTDEVIINSIPISYAILTYSTKILMIILRCIWEKESYSRRFYSLYHYVVFNGIVFNLDVIVMAQFIITYYLKCSVNVIKKLLKKPNRKLFIIYRTLKVLVNLHLTYRSNM